MVRVASSQVSRAGASKSKGAKASGLGSVERPAKMAVNSFDKEMAEIAAKQVAAESGASGDFISTKGGHFSIDGVTVKGDKIKAVVVDSIFLNTWYEKPWDPSEPATPACYAFGVTAKGMSPHEDSEQPQHENCAECPLNKFGTANVGSGKGKACKNQRRLALILEEDLEDPEARMWLLNISVTSCKAWGGYVSQIVDTYNKPTCGVLTELELFTAKGKTYAQTSFAFERELDLAEMKAVLPRRKEAMKKLTLPFPKFEEEEEEEEKPKPKQKLADSGKARKFRR